MNIRRIADQYRERVSKTSKEARRHLEAIVGRPSANIHPQNARQYLGRWYCHLKKALGNEEDLKGLKRVMENLERMKKFFPANANWATELADEKREVQVKKLADISMRQFDRFLEKLPGLIEKSLRRSIRKAGF